MPFRRRSVPDRLTFELGTDAPDGDWVDLDDVGRAEGIDAGPVDADPAGTTPADETGTDVTGTDVTGTDGTGTDGARAGDARLPLDDDGSHRDRGTRPGDRASATPAARRRRRTRVVVAATAAAVLVGGMGVADLVRARAEAQRLTGAVGGVLPLVAPPTEQWTADVSFDRGLGVLPGLVVTGDGDAAVALDLDTGEEAWRTDLGGEARCGGWLLWSPPSGVADLLTCLVGMPDEPRAVVLDADGRILGEREMEADPGFVAPGPGDSVLRVARVGEPAEGQGAELSVDPQTGDVAEVPPGRDAVVALEEATSGRVRWQHEIEFRPDTWRCAAWEGETPVADLEPLWATPMAGVVHVEGCGVSASFSPDGVRLDDPGTAHDTVSTVPDGTFVRHADGGSAPISWPTDSSGHDALLDADGEVRWQAPGAITLPSATDGGEGAVRLVQGEGAFRGYDAATLADDPLWELETGRHVESVLVEAAGVVVLSTPDGIVGVDAMSGRELWHRERGDLDDAFVQQALTDGRRAILVAQDRAGGVGLVALDLVDGTTAWERPAEGDGSFYLALQGALLVADGSAMRLTRLG